MSLIDRRRFIQRLVLGLSGGTFLSRILESTCEASSMLSAREPLVNGFHAPIMTFPEKHPLLMHSDSPPLLESARRIFDQAITANEDFFVRWHHPVIPEAIDLNTYRLSIRGHVERPLDLSVAELRSRFESTQFYAVKQCGGNSRSFYKPFTSGVQWQHGAMGCALWRGVRLKDVLAAAGIRPNSAYIKLHGLERPVFPETPAFVRKLDYEEFNRDNVIIAYEMNGEELPLLNGYPLVLVVPGYFADNWVKMIERIDVLDHEEEIFYTDKAYRIPANSSESVPPGYPMPAETKPLKTLKIKSVIGGPAENAIFHPGDKVKMSGVAFDDGHGVKAVFVSVDAGVNWVSAELDRDLGNYAFRRWNYSFTPTKKGAYTLMSRAVSNSGAIQPLPQDIGWNPAGYQWNAVDRLDIKVV